MKAKHLYASNSGAIEQAALLLQQGHPVIFPTDTLYGIGVDPFNEAAIEALYEAKGRPQAKGIPILLADGSDLDRVAQLVPPEAHRLITRFWPGPLTLIVPRRPSLPGNLSPNENVAVRIPDHTVSRALIRAAGGAVATSSANRSGAPPATTATEALNALSRWAAAVLDDGPSPHGMPSTIVDCTATPLQVVRVGPLSAAELGLE